jgi:hypothetical protein
MGQLLTGASNSSFVNGPVKKVGNTAFELNITAPDKPLAPQKTPPSLLLATAVTGN